MDCFVCMVTHPQLEMTAGGSVSGTQPPTQYLNDSNWYRFRDDITVNQLVIISLDIGTETYMQLSLPRGVDEVSYDEPIIFVLMDCLCISHHIKEIHFVIWIMTEFGVEQS
jgi:hypothetical protein